ncbi:hypothetical protein BOX15_Mlig015335g1 [Macrostomum lignano]|uniref:Mediator of RNA polymerase II transcription subunit 13 n=3 Tax=Macrostomum lignano TaxID=282301 RepID=A0A267EPQ9_9PLAT|nr:hypothetical protein BOX15_Mlig015335g1 [Macrostomum lignano]
MSVFTLEYCYTNIFAIASLKEIHYRRYRIAQPVESAHTCSDPVFSSFAKCQRCGILSAWKRYLPDTGDPSKPYDYGNYEKELWVFWHGGHDPPQLRDSLAHDLTPWSDSSDGGGISYEVRTMLFKAVHNCIERCLTGKGYVRLGQWFVRPLVPGLCLDPAVTQQFSLALNYFLHGESVCAAVDAKLYPPVHSLTKQQCQARTPVILSPHGIAGELTGREWDSQNQIESLVWREFFPHVRTDRGFVEVAVGQHRLWYPVDLLFATQAPLPPEPLSQIELNLAAESSADACLQHLLGCQGSDANGVHQQQQQQRCTCRRRTKPRPALTSAYHNRFFQATERTVDREPAMPTLSPQEPLSVEESEAAAAAASGAASIPTADGVGQQPSLKGLPKSEPISPPAAASVEAAKSQGDGVGLMDDESQQQQTQAAAASALAESSSSRPASVKTPQSQPTGSESQPASAAAAAAAPTPPLPPPPPPPPTSSAQQQQQQQPPPLPASSMPNGQASSVAADSLLEPGLGWLSVVQQSLRKRPLPQLEPWEADLNDSGHDVVSELPEWTSLAAYAKHARLLLPARGILNGPASSANATAAGSVGGSGAASGVALPIDDSASPSGIGSLVGLRSSPSKAGLSADSKSTAVSLKSEDILKVENLQMQSIFEVESPEPLDNANAACEGPGLHGNPSSSGCVIGGTSMASCGGSGTLPASDLCRIYPTPPSLENHIHPSPAPETDQANMLSPAAAAAGHHHHHHHASADCGSGPDLANDDDWSFLTSQRHQGGSLGQLFTAQNPPMPHLSIVYVPELPQTHRPHRAAAAAAGHAGGGHYGIGQQIAATPSSASVTAVGHMPAGTPVTPGSFAAVATPASVRTPGQAGTPCGSIVGEQLDQSQLSTGHQSIQASQAQPVEALRLNLLLSDSLLCLCRDQNFEACNICVCHGDLTGSEAGLYMPGLLDRRPSPCQCGFSASANRALGLGSNIFYEDLCDLLGDRRRLDYRPWPSTYSPAVIDSLLNFVSLTIPLRQFRSPPAQQQQSQSDATNSAVAVVAGAAAAAGAATADPAASSSLHPGHLAQFEDCNEAAKLVLQACTQGLHQPQQQQQPFSLAEQPTLLHRWSLTGQLPTAGSDLVRLLKSLRPWFQDSLWGKALQGNYWVTGPMTWQEFHQFARRGSEESCEPQPLPLISVYTDRDEGMLIAPTAVRDWERLGLEPYSRPKKLQFVVLAPVQASRVLKKAVRRTMSELTVAFADCKLGEHSPVALSTDGDFFLDTGRLESTELPPNCVVYMLVRGQTEACQLRDTVAKLTGGAVPVPLSTRLLLAPAKGDLRALALRVYTQVPKRVPYPTDGRSLCGFGPLKDRESCQRELGMTGPVSLFAPPYVLHASSDEPVLLCAYCLSEDRRWLLATLTDERGELNYRRLINLRVPDCHRRRKASTRQLGPERLLEWICDLPETRAQRWRLVLSRLGRLGHGELLVWADLLKRASLQQRGARSAALCAVDADPHLRVLPDQLSREGPQRGPPSVGADRRVSSAITHILVLPTSASFSQANPADFLGGSLGEPDLMNELLGDPGVLGGDTGNDLFNDLDLNFDIQLPDIEEPVVGPQGGDGSGQLMQQPLALGYYLSSAPPGPVPAWFRVAPPEQAAVCLRASLHLNQLASCDRAPLSAACDRSPTHPLNTYKTTEVLRYVLETCHSLSWLSVDPATGDRVSCLPRHINQLFLLYHSVHAVSASCQTS